MARQLIDYVDEKLENPIFTTPDDAVRNATPKSLLIIVDTVNGFVLHYVNRGADFALFSMAFALFLTKYLRLRKKHELIITIIWGVLALSMLVVWILQLIGVL